MKKRMLSLVGTMVVWSIFCSAGYPSKWINEIHYDDPGADINEAIEVVVGPDNTDPLSSIEITLYNGIAGTGLVYNTFTLDTFSVGDTVNGYTFYYILLPSNSIQNGAPDGLSLSVSGVLVPGQLLSYEGVFSPAVGQGPGGGFTSTDMGVLEISAFDPVGSSLALEGVGSIYGDFTWSNDNDPSGGNGATFGSLNNGQTLLGGTVVPEPASLILLSFGLAGLIRRRLRK